MLLFYRTKNAGRRPAPHGRSGAGLRPAICALVLCLLASCAQHPGTRVDSIWTARYVVTMDPARRIIENGAVAISGDHIVEAGTRAEIDGK
jgi:hypothetical protein